MKLKTIIAATLLLTFSVSMHAQVSLGLKGGVNFSNIYATQALDQVLPDFESISTYSIGAVAEVGISEQFAFQSELLFTRKGFGLREGLDVDLLGVPVPLGVTAETQINYVEVPLLAKYKFGTEGISAYITAGPTLGYATSGQINTKANVLLDFNIAKTPINLDAINFQRFEIGGAAGAGLAMQTGMGQFFIDARYNIGFTQLYDIPLVNEKLRNRGISLSAGFLVPLGSWN